MATVKYPKLFEPSARSRSLLMWKPERCDLCGECLEACQYLGYDRERAKKEIEALVTGKPTEVLERCITCQACNTYCYRGAMPFDLIITRMEKEASAFKREAASALLQVFCFNLPRNYIRKTKKGAPWMSICCMEYLQPQLFEESRLFQGLNIVGGGDYFCAQGMVHGRQITAVFKNVPLFIQRLNNLPTDEIIFYHDECYATVVGYAKAMKLELNFRPVHLLEWLIRVVKENYKDVRRLGIRCAVQLPCSSRFGPDRHVWIKELFNLIGVELVERKYDRRNQLCCGAVPALGGGPYEDLAENQRYAQELREKNIADAKKHGAEYMMFLCPFCYAALARDARAEGITPVMVADLVRMALYDEEPTEYVTVAEKGVIYRTVKV